MIKIKVSTARKGVLVFPWSVKRGIPECWSDLSDHDRLRFIRYLISFERSKALMCITRDLLNLKKRRFRRLSAELFVQVADKISWMNLEPAPEPIISSFEHKGTRYHLPEAKFKNGTCLEYPIADDYYNAFVGGDNNALKLLTATLCREAKPNIKDIERSGDFRIEMVSRSEAEARALALDGLPDEILIIVMLYFAGVKEYIHKVYGDWLFPKQEDEDNDSGDKAEGAMFGWWGVYMDIAETGIFGNLNAVYQSNFHTLCMYLVKKKKEAADAERRRRLSSSNPDEV